MNPRAIAPPWSRWRLAALVLTLGACSAEPPAMNPPATARADMAPSATEALAAACQALAQASCARLQACSPFTFQQSFADAARCVARTSLGCAQRPQLRGSQVSTASISGCAQAIAALDCASFLSSANLAPAACRPAGLLGTAAACGDASQCQSGFCDGGGASCGSCAPRAPVGMGCDRDARCESGLVCAGLPGNGVCQRPGARGAACSAALPCLATLSCQGGQCAPALTIGAACTSSAQCDVSQGLTCDMNFKCAATTLVAPGEACGFLNNRVVGCTASAGCFSAAGAQRCVAAASDGQPCAAAPAGPGCQVGAICQGGAGAQVCAVFEPASCK